MMTYVTAMQGKGISRVYLDQNGNVDIFSGGTRAARNHNPGNLRYTDFAKSYGAIGRDRDGFAIFPDSNTGKAAHQALLSQPRD
ncbi:hypothetical protein [Methylobacterium sp. 1030]|uniref:hypothetical protein n=1 Tax=Methylobacterium sp. 1030 TaxID=3156404 RepID=UPI00339426AA